MTTTSTRPVCTRHRCGREAIWRLRSTCECLKYFCSDCRDETERLLTHLLVDRGEDGTCAQCLRPLNPGRVTWLPLAAEDELRLSGALVADVEAALRGIG